MSNLKLIILSTVISLVSAIPAYAVETGQAEIVLTDIWLEPEHPQAGDKVTIVGNVYNGGTYRTEYYAKVVTVGFFIDGELRKIVELGNVDPGATNSIQISTGSFWDAEWGNHNMTAIIDYHDTLSDQYDNPKNNIIKKTFKIEPFRIPTISLDVSPSYIIPKKESLITVTGNLTGDSNTPLSKQNVLVYIGNDEEPLMTDKNGTFSIIKAITFSQDRFQVTASFDGNFPYLATNQSAYVFNLPPSKDTSALVLKIQDPKNKYDFTNLPSEIAIFQDSYNNLYMKISTTKKDVLLDNKTAWTGLAGNHSYLEEVYVNGRFFFATDWEKISDSEVLEQDLYVPETAQIRFHVTNEKNESLVGATISNWIYSAETDETGYTSWIEMLPTRTKNEPYIATVSSNDKIFKSDPFFVVSGERKIIDIEIQSDIQIPSWIRNSAKWWAENNISDSEFIQGIQFLIKEKVMIVPETKSGPTTSNEIPSWVRNNAKWWADGLTSDQEFVSGIQYLVTNNIIRVSP